MTKIAAQVEGKYCYSCGELIFNVPKDENHRFDEGTGERLYDQKCINRKCEIGCSNLGDHRWGIWPFIRKYCKNCRLENPWWKYMGGEF